MSIEIPDSVAHDIRQPILGDSFGWAGLEPAAAKKSIVIHGTGSEAPLEDGFTMADYHVNHNGWGGIGVHAVCTEDGYPGKPQFGLPAGAHIQYVGDLLTWRAGCFDQNPGRIHIEISGNLENHPPTANQLRAVRAFIDFLLAPNNLLPSLNYYNQVTYHNAVPEQNTACPGWAHPSFAAWFGYLQGGAFPDALYEPAPVPAPIIETPVVPDPPIPTTGPDPTPIPVTVIKEYEATYRTQVEAKVIARPGAHAVDITTGTTVVADIPEGTEINVAGYFDYQGITYARTVYSETHNLWNGLDTIYFDQPTGQPSGPVAINTPSTATPAPDPILLEPDPTAVASNVTDEQFQEATVPHQKITLVQRIKELIAFLMSLVIKKKKGIK